MADIKEFVVNDRRKFTAEGEARPDAPPSEPKPPRPETLKPAEETEYARLTEHKGPQAVAAPGPAESSEGAAAGEEDLFPPPPSAEQAEQAKRAFDATVDRLDTAIRATNPGMEHAPEITFDRVIQSLYMQALMQLGGATAQGQQPQVDILGARQTIDMIGILAEKTKGNCTEAETKLLDTALFELRMGFLEVTQALSRQAAARQPGGGVPPAPSGPSIVR
ncbi:MAG: DUF1844 domain-containing protein [Acidobacteriaceae bacterium]